jgi:diguanylate cyclase (GGDEF)-like protein
MLDVDHFKAFNDRHGHRRGDEVLEQVGSLLRDGIRSSDSAYRYGGEEFGLLLRDTTLGAAIALCERLRVAVEERFAVRQQRITASFGVAALEPGMDAPADFIETADRALYQAKSAGRNRVVAAQADQRPG